MRSHRTNPIVDVPESRRDNPEDQGSDQDVADDRITLEKPGLVVLLAVLVLPVVAPWIGSRPIPAALVRSLPVGPMLAALGLRVSHSATL